MWPAIILMSHQNYCTDIDVIHSEYDVDTKTKFLMFIHHVLIVSAIAGMFFVNKTNIKIHILILAIELILWQIFNGCIMAILQREWINYTEEDLVRIHGATEIQNSNFYLITILGIVLDLLKLKFL